MLIPTDDVSSCFRAIEDLLESAAKRVEAPDDPVGFSLEVRDEDQRGGIELARLRLRRLGKRKGRD